MQAQTILSLIRCKVEQRDLDLGYTIFVYTFFFHANWTLLAVLKDSNYVLRRKSKQVVRKKTFILYDKCTTLNKLKFLHDGTYSLLFTFYNICWIFYKYPVKTFKVHQFLRNNALPHYKKESLLYRQVLTTQNLLLAMKKTELLIWKFFVECNTQRSVRKDSKCAGVFLFT